VRNGGFGRNGALSPDRFEDFDFNDKNELILNNEESSQLGTEIIRAKALDIDEFEDS
jgi:hypothetical protein